MKQYLLTILLENFWTKTIFALLCFLTPMSTLFHTMVFIIGVDFVTGCIKSIRKSGWRSIKSSGFRQTILKMTVYMLLILSLAIFEKYIFGLHTLFITTYCIGLVLSTELFSIFENVAEISGNSGILKIKDIINNIFNKKTNEIA